MKTKRIVVAIICILVVVLSASMFTACNKKPEIAEGAVYVTEVKTFWAGVGKAYISFEYKDEPAEKVENELYGYVFYVQVDSGDGYSTWLKGSWALDETKNTLTLTATWDTTADNPTSLADAESGVAKEYNANGGKYEIGVKIPSANTVNFVLDPVANKVGDKKEDGKPDDGDGPQEATVQLTMNAKVDGGQKSKIELLTDNTWKLSISYYDGGAYTETASGTWAMNGTSAITLTVVTDSADVISTDTVSVAIDATDVANIVYTCDITCTVPQIGALAFEFCNVEKPAATVQLTMTGSTAGGQSAKIELLTDNNWKLSISYYDGGAYTETASGTWAMNGYVGMNLTVVTDTADVLAKDTYTITFDFASNPGNIVYTSEQVDCVIPQMGTLPFTLTATAPVQA